MTKQLVGALPLAWPATDLLRGRSFARARRPFAAALAIAAALSVPWLVFASLRFGRPFWHDFLAATVAGRLQRSLHVEATSPSYYVTMLWQREGVFALLGAAGLVFCAWRKDPQPLVWTLAVLVPFSISASRYDYYALLLYPALALGAACLVASYWRGLLVPFVVAASVGLHVLPLWGQLPPGNEEMIYLAHLAKASSRADDVLLVTTEFSYASVYYSDRHVVRVVFDDQAVTQLEREQWVLGRQETVRAASVAGAVAGRARWFAVVPIADQGKIGEMGTVYRIGRTPTLMLLTNVAPNPVSAG
jgi:hypothetical protein